ncbi:ABC transporter permease [Arthrobacter sp. Sa2CUA1]|uniref:ABC transporter permease n=1 Tax=Arthrobacter gallicola TaxID=2762225 RepID=A0ABR8UMU1_9MICC|nr:ABC transporter permease [Arthrobacter gallicola]MBD7993869.1 ABC transporter permease [Arthrobacter gallicola]
MDSTLLSIGPAAWLLLAALLLTAALVSALLLARSPWAVLAAGARAVLQLAVVALLISELAGHPAAAAAFVLLMFGVASFTAGRRVTTGRRGLLMAVPIAAGVLPVLGLMLASGVLPLSALALIAVAGQLIGGAMTASTLAGRRLLGELRQRSGEVEAALALGFPDPEARTLILRPVAGEALIPALDQTRTVGLVTLPGAFVGLILGGASPVDAALVQLLVLVALLAVEALAIAVVLHGCAAGWWAPGNARARR